MARVHFSPPAYFLAYQHSDTIRADRDGGVCCSPRRFLRFQPLKLHYGRAAL